MARKSSDRTSSSAPEPGKAVRDAGALAVRAGFGGPAGLGVQALNVARRYPGMAIAASALAGFVAGRRAQRLPPEDTTIPDAWAPQVTGCRGPHPPAQDHRELPKRMELERRNGRS